MLYIFRYGKYIININYVENNNVHY